MANCCGSSRCTCRVIAGPGITVDGNGSPGAPYVIGGGGGGTTVVEAGTGVTVTGTGTAADPYEVSAVPPETGCGLTGDGSAGSPLAAVVAAWPYPCDADTSAGGVYCDNGRPASQACASNDHHPPECGPHPQRPVALGESP